ncbi:MAG: UvrD-helicase domain-containing protein [Promethearchaeota archaeon]
MGYIISINTKLKECGYLPGGIKNYYNSLNLILKEMSNYNSFSYIDYKEKMIKLFPNMTTDRSLKGILGYINSWGFFEKIDTNEYRISELGKDYLIHPSKIRLFNILCGKIILFKEIYDLIEHPLSINQIYEYIQNKYFKTYGLNWTTTKQIKHRLDFYMALDAVEKYKVDNQTLYVQNKNFKKLLETTLENNNINDSKREKMDSEEINKEQELTIKQSSNKEQSDLKLVGENAEENLPYLTLDEFYKKMYKALGWDLDNRELNEQQKEAINYGDGPLWIIAGPGSGKTEILAWRTLKLILVDKINPESIFLTTFTEKAANNLHNRIEMYLKKLAEQFPDINQIDISGIHLGTLHSLASSIMVDYDYEDFKDLRPLNDIEQILFIEKIFTINECKEILNIEPTKKLGKLRLAKLILAIFNRFIEDNINFSDIEDSTDEDLKVQLKYFRKYEAALLKEKKTDFAHIQSFFLSFLDTLEGEEFIRGNPTKQIFPIKYILVDEYQDTNPIQEFIYFKLAIKSHLLNGSDFNINVVGDDDQALYRFRGASIEAIINFDKNCQLLFNKSPKIIQLINNYRSIPQIVKHANEYIRYFKIDLEENIVFQQYRANNKEDMIPVKENSNLKNPIIIFNGKLADCAKTIAKIIKSLKESDIIKNFHDVAIILRSVKETSKNALPIINALKNEEIPYYNPRSRAVHEKEIVKTIFGLLIDLLIPRDSNGDKTISEENLESNKYVKGCLESYNKTLSQMDVEDREEIEKFLKTQLNEINDSIIKRKNYILNNQEILELIENHGSIKDLSNKYKKSVKKYLIFDENGNYKKINLSLSRNVRELFYLILGLNYFSKKIDDPMYGEDLVIISQLLESYSTIYSDNLSIHNFKDFNEIITSENWRLSRGLIFNYLYKFFNLISIEGINELEDPVYSIKPGHVQIITYHQAKGLEFPFVFMRNIEKWPKEDETHKIENTLKPYRKSLHILIGNSNKNKISNISIENEKYLAIFDRIRLMYVGMTRAIYGLFIFGTGQLKKDNSFEKSSWIFSLGYNHKGQPKTDISNLDNSIYTYKKLK